MARKAQKLSDIEGYQNIPLDWEPKAFQILVKYFSDQCVEESFYRIVKTIELADADQNEVLEDMINDSLAKVDGQSGMDFKDIPLHPNDLFGRRREITHRRYDLRRSTHPFKWYQEWVEKGWNNVVQNDGSVELGQFNIPFRREIPRAIDCLSEILDVNRRQNNWYEMIEAVGTSEWD